MFSPVLVAEVCPENCSIHTKTKYSEYWLQDLLLARYQSSGILCELVMENMSGVIH